jgi:dolichol-phosphate mannosyltransferase
MSRGKSITVVSPVLNERNNLPILLLELSRVFGELPYRWNVIFVNDGSDAETTAILERLTREWANVEVLHFSRNFGHQAALTAGLDHAEGDAVIVMDSDLQHPPTFIPKMIAEWEAGRDIVYTIRKETADDRLLKRLTSKLYYKVFNSLSDTEIPAQAADFRLFDREVVLVIRSLRERARFLRGLTTWVGFNQVGLEYDEARRHSGRSQFNLRRMLRLGVDGLLSMSTVPLRLCLATGFMLSGLSFAYMLYVIWAYFFTNRAIHGWSSMMVGMLFMGGVQLITVGIVGLYVAKVYEEVKQRPLYILRRPSRDAAARQEPEERLRA